MSAPLRIRPVRRWKVALGALLAVAVLAGIIGLAELLRPPAGASSAAEPPADDGDPRIPVECPQPPPREGARRATLAPATRQPEIVSSSELLDCPAHWDNQLVRYRGEVVGAILRRGDGAWLQLNDDAYAGDLGPLPAHRQFHGGNSGIGVHVPPGAAEVISVVGGPWTHGDRVEVVGRFHRIDSRSREVAVIRAAELRVLRAGAAQQRELLVDRMVVAVVLAAIAAALSVWQLLLARRRRRH